MASPCHLVPRRQSHTRDSLRTQLDATNELIRINPGTQKTVLRSHFYESPKCAIFEYNSRHSDRTGWSRSRKSTGNGEAQAGRKPTCVFSWVSPGVVFFLGGYVNEASPSASKQRAAGAIAVVLPSMRAENKACHLCFCRIGIPELLGDGAINQPAERQRYRPVWRRSRRGEDYFDRPRDRLAADDDKQRDRALPVPGCAAG